MWLKPRAAYTAFFGNRQFTIKPSMHEKLWELQVTEWSLPEDIERLRANRRKDMGFSEKLELADDAGGWRLDCYPKGLGVADHVSLYLTHVDASSTPSLLGPSARFSLIINNCKDPSKDNAAVIDKVFSKDPSLSWGAASMLALASTSVENGYLSKDGSLTVRVEMSSVCSKWAKDKQALQHIPKPVKLGTVGRDLLALLEVPAGTSDLTITVSGGRSFKVHRLILASRCPYVKALFAIALKDSTAKKLPMPDTDPDALALLLRYLYGGVLDSCTRKLLPAAAALADRLLLPNIFSTLRQRLLATTTHETIVEDMLWAERRDDKPLLSDLEKEYLDMADSIKPKSFELLAQRSPQLMARLHSAVLSNFKRRRTSNKARASEPFAGGTRMEWKGTNNHGALSTGVEYDQGGTPLGRQGTLWGFEWRLDCYTKGQGVADHVSLFLTHVDASTTPSLLCPSASCSLIIKNHKDPSKDVAFVIDKVFSKDPCSSWGAASMLALASTSVENGYLSKDGSLTVRVEFKSVCSKWAKDKQDQQQIAKPMKLGTVGGDLLTLLDEPGDTSDLTITVGDRSFHVHRGILASRCPYFKTLFASDFKDGTAKKLPMPDTDPDALAFMLRYLYGGVLDGCTRKLLPAAAALADRLLLPDVFSTLRQRLLVTTTHETIVEDMLWAAQRDDKPLLSDLEKEYLDKADSIEAESIELLAQRSPQLMGRLHKALASTIKRQRTC
ncbi:Kelch repeat and BTB domain-containing protein 5, partial [Tetrabaena socialis]